MKKLQIEAARAAHRELRIAEDLAARKLEHVVPVFDAGRDAESDSYFVVMPRAEKSLKDAIQQDGVFTDAEASQVLLEIAEGLSEVSDMVHRDLKPGNVLRHEGRWKTADFGIARFVEESTSEHTLKDFLTAAYAAPEQWRGERATNATDVYALGCIGYTLLTGSPPFAGPIQEDFMDQHLHQSPPPLVGHSARLRSLLLMMLRKPPEARPSVERVRHLLPVVASPTSSHPQPDPATASR